MPAAIATPMIIGRHRVKRRRSAEDTRALLLDAAAILFARKGLSGITLAEIAGAVGMSGPAIYNHFASKDALFVAVVEQMYDEEIAAFKSVLDPLQRVSDGLDALFELVPRLYRDDGTLQMLGLTAQIESARSPELYQPLIDASRRRDQVVIDLVERAKAVGEVDCSMCSASLGAMLSALLFGALGYCSLHAASQEQFEDSVRALRYSLKIMC